MKRRPGILLLTLCALTLAGSVDLHLFGRAVKNNVGQTLPRLDVQFLDAKRNLTGKPLILEFWATWCPPCRESIPVLNEFYKTYKDKGLEIVGITKEDEATVRGFLKEVPVDYPVALDSTNALAAIFGITVLPHTLIVDRTGKIIWEGHPLTMQPGDIEDALK